MQEDKSGTLGTGNDQTIFCLQGNGIDRADTAGCNGKGWREDTSYTLNTIDRPAVCAGVRCLTPWEAQSARVYDQDGVWHSLNANENGGMARDSVMCAGFKLGNSEQARSIGYAEEQSPTLNAECGGNKPAVMCLNDQGGNVMGVSHDVSGTLRAQEHGHQPAVIAFAQNQREEVRNVGDKAVSLAAEVGMHCQTFVALDMSHACDVIRDCGEVAPSLQARMGTGGNQVPLTYQDVTGTLHRARKTTQCCGYGRCGLTNGNPYRTPRGQWAAVLYCCRGQIRSSREYSQGAWRTDCPNNRWGHP